MVTSFPPPLLTEAAAAPSFSPPFPFWKRSPSPFFGGGIFPPFFFRQRGRRKPFSLSFLAGHRYRSRRRVSFRALAPLFLFFAEKSAPSLTTILSLPLWWRRCPFFFFSLGRVAFLYRWKRPFLLFSAAHEGGVPCFFFFFFFFTRWPKRFCVPCRRLGVVASFFFPLRNYTPLEFDAKLFLFSALNWCCAVMPFPLPSFFFFFWNQARDFLKVVRMSSLFSFFSGVRSGNSSPFFAPFRGGTDGWPYMEPCTAPPPPRCPVERQG